MAIDIYELVGSLRERLPGLGLDDQMSVHEPVDEEWIDSLRSQFPGRHLPEELVDYYRAGAVAPFEMSLERTVLDEVELADAGVLEQLERGEEGSSIFSPLSANWYVLGGGEDFMFAVTAPEPRRTGAILFWDAGGPGPIIPVFPSLGSMLWYWDELAKRLPETDIPVDEYRIYFFTALIGWNGIDREVRDIYSEAASIGGGHPGWVWGQPVPERRAGVPGEARVRWNRDWLKALGVGDLDKSV